MSHSVCQQHVSVCQAQQASYAHMKLRSNQQVLTLHDMQLHQHLHICVQAVSRNTKLYRWRHGSVYFVGGAACRLYMVEPSDIMTSCVMLQICSQVSQEEAEKRIQAIKEPYKLEILSSIAARTPDAPITIYHLGKEGEGEHWWDLCAGPHVETTKQLNPAAVELESIAGQLTKFCSCNFVAHSASCC